MATILQDFMKNTAGLSALWLGNDSWLLWDGKTLLGIDLDLMLSDRLQPSPVPAEELAQALDLLFVTHGHGDHFNTPTCRVLAQGKCRYILPESCRAISSNAGLPQQRCIYVRPGEQLDLGIVSFETVRALHGHFGGSVYSGASMLDCGYIFTFAGKRIYEPGDTVLLEEHYTLKEIDVLFVSPTEHNTRVENSKIMIGNINPGKIVAQHFGTYREEADNLFWTHGFVAELAAALPEEQRSKYYIPTQGVAFAL